MARWFELAEMSDSKLEKPYYLAEKLCWEVKKGESVVPGLGMISCAMSAAWLLPHSLSI
jgi:hypothetical protein